MCKECENLLNVDLDKKSTNVLKVIDSIDSVMARWIMEVNHNDDGSPYAFISHQLTIASTQRCYNTTVRIKFCPFCGEKLY